MDNTKALQNLLNGTASEEEIQLLKHGLVSREMSIGGNVNQSVIIIGSDNTVELTSEALDRLNARSLLGNLDRDLTGVEITLGLERLESELPLHAPVLLVQFQEQTRRLRPSLKTSSTSLSEQARKERVEALAVINSLCMEALDISFNALCLGEEPPKYDARSPFRGLESFRPEDSEFFFGREALTKKLVGKINAHSFIAVLGASGSGKSSLVMAGLISALDSEYIIFRPGTDPLSALESAKEKALIVVDQFEELFTLTRDEATRVEFIAKLLDAAKRTRIVLTLRSDFLGGVGAYRALSEEIQNHLEIVPPMDMEELRYAMDAQAGVVGLRFEADLNQQILDDVEGEPGAMPLLQHALWELWNRRHGRWLRAFEYRAFGGVKQAITSTAEKVYEECTKTEQEQIRDIFLRLTRLDDGNEERDMRKRIPLGDLLSSGRDAASITLLLNKLANARLIVKTVNKGKTEIEVTHEALIRHWERLRVWLNEDRDTLRLRESVTEDAMQWENAGRNDALLNHRGGRLDDAFLLANNSQYGLTSIEQTYLSACVALRNKEQRERERRLRWTVIASIASAIIFLMLGGFGLVKSNEATAHAGTAQANANAASIAQANAEEQTRISQQQARLSRARELSAVSQSISNLYPVRRLLLAIEASNTLRPTDSKVLSLQSTLYASLAEMGGTVIARDDNSISRLVVSHDNKWLAYGSESEKVVNIRDLSNPEKNIALYLDSANVTSLVFSPDDQWLAANNGKNIRLWDVKKTSSKSVDLEKHDDNVNALAFSPNGHWLVSGGDDQTILMWDLKNPSLNPELLSTQTDSIVALNFSANGRWLASINDGGEDNDIYLWDFDKEDAPILALKVSCWSGGYGGFPVLIMFSPDNRWLVTNCGGSTISALDTQNLDAEPVYMTVHSSPISALAFSPDGRWLVSGGRDETIRLWDMESPDKKSEILGRHKGSVNTLDFSADGNFLVSGGCDAIIQIWDMKWWPYRYRTSMTPVILRGHESSVTIVAFSETSHLKGGSLLLVSGGGDKTIRLWDVQKPSYIPTLVSDPLAKINQNSIEYLMFSSNGQWMASAGYFFAMGSYPTNNILSLWDVKNMDAATIALNDIIVSPNPVEFSSDNHWLAYGSSESVRLVDLNKSPVKYIELDKLESLVEVMAFDPGSQMLAVGDLEQNLKVYNINAPQAPPLVLNGDSRSFTALSFSPDSRWLASGAVVSLLLWDMQHPQNEPVILKGNFIRVSKVSFHGDWLASAGWDNHVNLWKMSNIEKGLIEPIILSHPESNGGIYSLVFSHNGRWIASGSNDGTICLWDLFNVDKPPLILEHELAVNSLAFSKDDKWLASGSDDGTARIWMVDSTIPSSAILQSGSVAIKSVDFSPDGKWLSVGSDDSIIKIWNVNMTDALDNACKIAGRNFTRAEWGQYFPNYNYPSRQDDATCPQWLLDPIITPTEMP